MRIGPITLALALSTLSSPVAAHKFTHPKALRLGVQRDRIFLSVTYDVNPGDDSRLLRALFDRDSSGLLDTGEQQKLTSYLERMATLWLRVRVGGETAKLVRTDVAAHRLGLPPSSTDSLGISILYAAPLPSVDLVSIEIDDRDKDAASHVPLVADLDEGLDVAFASQGELHRKARQIQRVKLRADTPLVLRIWRDGRPKVPAVPRRAT